MLATLLVAPAFSSAAASFLPVQRAGAAEDCIANATVAGETSCSFTTWLGSTYAAGTPAPNGSTPTLTSASITTDIKASAGSTIRVNADWSSSETAYGEPPACPSSVPITASAIRGMSPVMYCGYWVFGQNGVPTSSGERYTGTVAVTDLVDWWDPSGHYAWRMPYGTTSAVYGCITGSATCSTGSHVPSLSLSGGNLCENAFLGGSTTPTRVWCSDTGVLRSSGGYLSNTQFANWPSFNNSSWNQPQHNGTPSTGSLRLQWTGNLVVQRAPVPDTMVFWASERVPLCMPVTSTPSGGCTRTPTAESAVVTPGSYETMVLFSQSSSTDATGNATHVCKTNSIGYETFANPRVRGPSPTDCSAHQCPVDSSSVHCAVTIAVPSAPGDVFLQYYVFEWDAAGGYAQGGAYAFPLAHSAPVLAASGTPPPTTTSGDGIWCKTGQTWVTSCSAPVGTRVTVKLHISPVSVRYPTPPRSGSSSTDNPYARCHAGSTCALHITASAAPAGSGLTTTVRSSGNPDPGTCGIGVMRTGTWATAKASASLTHTFVWTSPDGWTPDTASFTAFYIPNCGENHPTTLYDWYLGHDTPGPEPSVEASWYDHTFGIGFAGSNGAASYWIAGSTHNPTMPDGYTSLMLSTGTTTQLAVTNDTAGTYTVRGRYLWWSVHENDGLDNENQYVRGPTYSLQLTFTSTSSSAPPPPSSTTTYPPPPPTTYPTATSLTGAPNPATEGEVVVLRSMTTLSGAAVQAGSVTFTFGTTTLCTGVATSSGSATCDTSVLPVGADVVTAHYSGVSNEYTPSEGSTTIRVGAAPVVLYPT
jgi:hypothetical protein